MNYFNTNKFNAAGFKAIKFLAINTDKKTTAPKTNEDGLFRPLYRGIVLYENRQVRNVQGHKYWSTEIDLERDKLLNSTISHFKL